MMSSAEKLAKYVSKEDVAAIREILENNEDKTHMGIALALCRAGFKR